MRLRRFAPACAAALFACTKPPAPSPPPTSPAPQPEPEASNVIAIVGVTVLPMTGEEALPAQNVIIRDGVIAAIEPTASSEPPAGAQAIDGRGKFLLPGLADMHVHVFVTSDLALMVSYGVTTTRNMFGNPMHLDWRKRIAAGELLGPTFVTAGPIIDGKPPVWPGSAVVETAADAERVVAEQAEAGYDFLKVYSKLTPEAYEAIVKAAAAHHMRFAGHVPLEVPLSRAREAGQLTIEHLEGYMPALQRADSATMSAEISAARGAALLAGFDPSKVPAVAAATAASETYNCPTLIVMHNISLLNDLPSLEIPELAYVNPAIRNFWDPKKDFRFAKFTDEDYQRIAKTTVLKAQITKALADAGARLIAGTDLGNPYTIPGYSLHQELALLVEAGLTPMAALRAATVNAGQVIEPGSRRGTVVAGAPADLVLLEADPRTDIHNTLRIDGVVLRGRWMPRAELDQVRDDIKRQNSQAPPPAAQ